MHASRQPPARRATLGALAAAGLWLTIVPAAQSATKQVLVRGAGFGHGIGMSQYGAYGFAQQGTDYETILKHYYRGTELNQAPSKTIRVLLQTTRSVRVRGLSGIVDGRSLETDETYAAGGFGNRVVLRDSAGEEIGRFEAPLKLKGGPAGIRLVGRAQNGLSNGRYRGTMEIRPGGLGMNVINAVGLDDYVRGVISAESPASWPEAALQAQAVAARTYAITTKKPVVGFDHYADVRSQVYKGIEAEFPSTDAAAETTAGEVVTYDGTPAVTYFFSTSGGQTEDVENSFLGADPKPWLRSVKDPYDKASPRHRWSYRWSMGEAQRRFGDWVKGRFRGVQIIKRGSSPRVVSADIIGTRGRTRVTGPQVRARLGLPDTWVSFKVTGVKAPKPPAPPPAATPVPVPTTPSPPQGGATPRSPRLQVTAAQLEVVPFVVELVVAVR